MKIIHKIAALGLAVLTAGALTVTAAAASDYGSGTVEDGQTYTIEQMLTYAIEDEYLARAEYEAIIDAFDADRPFSRVIRGEERHIDALERLFETYGIAVPADTSADHVAVPASIEEALNTGVAAEEANIAMYATFLAQDLPDDVEAVFTALQRASTQHLRAFQYGLDHPIGSGAGRPTDRPRNAEAGLGLQDGTCPTDGVPLGGGLGSDDAPRGGGRSTSGQPGSALRDGTCLVA